MKKISIILILILLSAVFTANADFEDDARALYELGLLKGTGDAFSMEALKLDRDATRAEACITLIRMLGKEEKAAYQGNPHPFNDVPEWASASIGWLYENWLVNGVGATYFGAYDIATVQQFSAMTLRALGYNEQDGDFEYANAVSKAMSVGLFDSSVAAKYELSRRDMISIINNAMRTNLNNSRRTLIEKLCDDGAVDRDSAEMTGILKKPSLSDVFMYVPDKLGPISAKREEDRITIKFIRPYEHYGLRVFYSENGGTATEVPYSGHIYMQKGEISYVSGGAEGYLEELYVYGLDPSKKYTFIVLKTTSEGSNYTITAKSAVAEVK